MYLAHPRLLASQAKANKLRQAHATNFTRTTTVSYQVITEAIVAACLRNDRKAQRELYAYCYPILLKVCARYAGTTDDIVEMTNTCFIKVVKNLHTLSDINTLGGWVKQIAVNASIDMYRSGKKYRERNRFTIDTEYSTAANTHVGSDHTESRMDSHLIFQIIRALPDTTREVLNLFAIEGYSHREIANTLHISEEASRWHLHKARNLVAEQLKKMNYNIKRNTHG
ncbi:MAG: RNA polymerase sigma factor [Chitinophagaceae bacterium]|nr:RNA polymerase sigma factor [Chitinophagaceae bacterium]